jgi:hypothetical protein
MAFIKNAVRRSVAISYLSIAFMLMMMLGGNATAGEWSYSGSVRYAYGNYIYTTKTQSYYFLSSLRYRTERYRLSLGLPVIAQNSSLIAFGGGGMMPRTRAGSTDGMGQKNSGQMNPANESSASTFDFAFGDLFLNGEFTLLNEDELMPKVALTGQLKKPVGSTATGASTGAWDYGLGLSLNKSDSHRYAALDLAYYWIGDAATIDYENALSYGVGYGHHFNNDQFGFLLYLSGYSKILQDYEAPSQFSFTANYRVSSGVALSGGFNYGLSNTVPDFAIFAGVTSTL